MGYPAIFLAVLLAQTVFALTDDSYDNLEPFLYGDEAEAEPLGERKPRNDKFLRFGKRFWDYDTNNDVPFDDSEMPRPSRTGSLSGDPQQRSTREKSSFLRFGRSIEEETKKKRGKREVSAPSEAFKRHENYLRFGRNSNFMRFGRTPHEPLYNSNPKITNQNEQLLEIIRHLLKQSEQNRKHNIA